MNKSHRAVRFAVFLACSLYNSIGCAYSDVIVPQVPGGQTLSLLSKNMSNMPMGNGTGEFLLGTASDDWFLEKMSDIAIIQENAKLQVNKEKCSVSSSFLMKNLGKSRTVKIALRTGMSYPFRPEHVIEFLARVDGEPVKSRNVTTTDMIPLDSPDTPGKRITDGWKSFDVAFAENQVRKIDIRYFNSVESSGPYSFPPNSIKCEYFVHRDGYSRAQSGPCNVEVALDGMHTSSLSHISPQPTEILPNKVVWKFQNPYTHHLTIVFPDNESVVSPTPEKAETGRTDADSPASLSAFAGLLAIAIASTGIWLRRR